MTPCFKIPTLLGLVLLGAVSAGCQNDSQAPGPKAAPPPAPISVTQVGARKLVVQRAYLGEAVARSDASLSAAEAGRVKKVLVEEGAQVKAGQLLVVLDDRLARAELGEAIASRRSVVVQEEQATREAKRYEQLQKDAVISSLEADREVDEAERLALAAKGAEETVKVQSEHVQRHRIEAPFDGVVARRLVDPGDWLTPGQTALQLITPQHVEVLVQVPESALSSLSKLTKIELASQGRRAAARLDGVVNALDPTTRTGLLRVSPVSVQAWLLPGASVDVVLSVERNDGWVLPRDALVYGIGEVRIILVENAKAKPLAVKVVDTAGDLALIDAELSPGQAVVVRGNERLRPGQSVRVVDEATKP